MRRLFFALFAVALSAQAQQSVSQDPTRPVAHSPVRSADSTQMPEGAPRAKLNAVLKGRHGPIAIIDGQQYRAGDRLQGFEITQIDSDKVWLRDADKQYQLALRMTVDVKKDAANEF